MLEIIDSFFFKFETIFDLSMKSIRKVVLIESVKQIIVHLV